MSNSDPAETTGDPQKIKIDSVNGGKDKDELKGCYFLPTATPDVYNFYSKTGTLLASNVFSGATFSFMLPSHQSYTWTIPNPAPGSEQFSINTQAARGSWFNTDPSPMNDEGGTFTAQATGGADDGEESASTATA